MVSIVLPLLQFTYTHTHFFQIWQFFTHPLSKLWHSPYPYPELHILICYKGIYNRSNLSVWQVKDIIMNGISVNLLPWTCFAKIGHHLGFRTLWIFTAKYISQDYFVHDNWNLRYRSTYCCCLFGIFSVLCGGYFENCSEREVHHRLFPVDISDSYSGHYSLCYKNI